MSDWVVWFAGQFEEACKKSASIIRAALDKAHFWQAAPRMNARQKKVVQKLLDAGAGGFEGEMSAEKYGNITGASKATATRDLSDLTEKGVLKITGQGRGTRYWIAGAAGRESGRRPRLNALPAVIVSSFIRTHVHPDPVHIRRAEARA